VAGSWTEEVARRRTFAIISHPDAGKTTLTEKLLLYGGAVHLAGAVRARRRQRATVSDWMAMERSRGISITSTVLSFECHGLRLNLLDTPGHADFSEDTYRTVAAADCAVMVVDAGRGVEEQTRKLFRVARARGLPVLTFVNKMDRPGLGALALLDVVEESLGVQAVPITWPVGEGSGFAGVYDREKARVSWYQRTEHGERPAPVRVGPLAEAEAVVGEEAAARLRDELALLDGAVGRLDRERFLRGEATPVFFGSALTNFGLDAFLEHFLDLAPAPAGGEDGGDFAGFVFKIQSNMDPLHRDSVAFVRVTRGVFRRDDTVVHGRTGRRLRLGQAMSLFGRERETVDLAYAGDVVGVPSQGTLAIGDVLYVGERPAPVPLPRFAPEHFAVLDTPDVAKRKAFLRGVQQLEREGAVQVWSLPGAARRAPLLAAVGVLQFDVVRYRLREEYGVETTLEVLPHRLARWVDGPADAVAAFAAYGTLRCQDGEGRPVVLFPNERELAYCVERHPSLAFRDVAAAEAEAVRA
jgi:peptide chain release factor 3